MRIRALLIYLLSTMGIASIHAQYFSNKGKEFWTAYGNNQLFSANSQEMVLYLSADNAVAHVTVSINGTSWVKNYTIQPHSVVVSDLMPKTGTTDCRVTGEGLFSKGIHIQSDTAIAVFAHTYGSYSSGGTMLLPVESYGYTYLSLNPVQDADASSYSWFYVVASEDNTLVRITPARPTAGNSSQGLSSRAQGVAFTVTLNKGQVYNIMGQVNGNSYDESGSKIQSLPGADGRCHPIALFSGSGRTNVCKPGGGLGSSDYIMQQMPPVNAWGTRYITALTSSTVSPSQLSGNTYRVYVKDPTTLVRRNGALVTGLTNNFYYEITSTTADVITATKPVAVAQFIPSQGGCNSVGDGDPEMFCLSPIDQAINSVTFYSTNQLAIETNYITAIVPQSGMSTFVIDGSKSFDYTYPHPNAPGYTVVVKQLPLTPMQHTASCDSLFTAIAYGLGTYESYGFNAGTLLKNLESVVKIKNDSGTAYIDYTCAGTPFHPVLKTIYSPATIYWKLSAVNGLSPNADVTQTNYPRPTDSVTENGMKYYIYQLPGDYTINAVGTYIIPVIITDLQIENCSFSDTFNIPITVKPAPVVNFTFTGGTCTKDSVHFAATSPDAALVSRWNWSFGDNTIDSVQNAVKAYMAAGTYPVNLRITRKDGCIGTAPAANVTVYPPPVAGFQLPQVVCMPGGMASFINTTVSSGNSTSTISYTWSFGDGSNNSSDTNAVHYYAAKGNYAVQLKATTDKGCSDSITKTLPITAFADRPQAAMKITAPAFCQDSVVTFTDLSTPAGDINKWSWNFGDGSTPSLSQNTSWLYAATGSHTVQLVVTSTEGCKDTTQQTITIYTSPSVEAGPDKVIVRGGSAQLNGSTNITPVNILWTPNVYISDPGSLITSVSPQNDQLYYLTITGQGGCTGYDSVQVRVLDKIVVPNVFSPNHDGINDTWMINGLNSYPSVQVAIYDRDGRAVFTSRGYNQPWDGTINGRPVPVATYYYVITIGGENGGTLSGYVAVLR